ncbi:type 1 fimbrial protein [Klebsiella pasteurii]|uniref:Type 1 fimbrial protein n=1 Tax=Klebsiella pasteurii TaxID=2587529 RepID=A0ABT5CPQ4_9ENTR|nr:type 1 fimbrial protein [Klebsiella pasteurii]MDC0693482.1 type 1 fimbrial protein [Klebsiella pasteurii]MDC0755188.1 type 1 fimbrial protein [Klebsiella pasteurii]MDQ2168655.1 type 1 fimbrial protein [Klebsiella pasteurii]MDQ2200713.1 type 1 fimbrial protein [Klebsiella pasteurii]MDQ2224817.1 type 1 fimbrial protein [Klebsiella pasteurii]
MKTIIYTPLAALFILPSFVNPVLAEQTVAGVIHFYGRVVEAPCQLNTIKDQIIMDCPRADAIKISAQQLEKGNIHNENIRSAQLRYINPQRTLAILDVDYR